MYSISIPRPCLAGWENMHPQEKGRYCISCAKTVVDFSIMNDADIQAYFVQHHGEKICGHFKKTQLQRIVIHLPENALQFNQPFWKTFLVLSLVIFGTTVFPFETSIAGIHSAMQSQQIIQKEIVNKKPRIAKKQKRRKYRIRQHTVDLSDILSNPDMNTIDGFTTTIPVEKTILLAGDRDPVMLPAKNDSNINDTNLSAIAGIASKKEDEQNPKPIVPFSAEYIIPSILTSKKQSQKSK